MSYKLPYLEDCIISEKSKNGWVYDVETYLDFFCISFYNGKKHVQYQISSIKNELSDIQEFINKKNLVFIGYNNSKFDDYILGYINKNYKQLSSMPYNHISQLLMNVAEDVINYFSNGQKDVEEKIKGLRRYNHFTSIDLMKVSGIQKSLKLVAVSLKWYNIQDLPYPFDQHLDESKIEEVMLYNQNDTEITFELLKRVRKEIELRFNLSNLYSANLLSESDSGISNILFDNMYRERTTLEHYKEIRTHRKAVKLSDCIFSKVEFTTPPLQNMLVKLRDMVLLNSNNFEFKFPKVLVGGKSYVFGKGGLHSEDDARRFENSSDLNIIDSDVTSYYPAIMINYKVKPEKLEDVFTDIMVNLTEERIKAKKEGDKVKADGLKIVINSTFGKLGFEGYFLYDEQAMFKVTINGQLFLLMLIEMLTCKKFEVISANTDGIITLVPKNRLEEYYSVCKEWEAKLDFTLEYTYYSKYVRRDVNNYLAQTTDGKVKSKGAFLQEIDLRKGYDSPIIALAIKAYFFDGINVEEFIRNHDDIYDFCISEKMGRQFKAEYDGNLIQKSVRYYVSTNGKKLIKYKTDIQTIEGEDDISVKRTTDLVAGKLVTLFNRYEKKSNYDIDYNFYIKEANKIVYEIIKGENFIF